MNVVHTSLLSCRLAPPKLLLYLSLSLRSFLLIPAISAAMAFFQIHPNTLDVARYVDNALCHVIVSTLIVPKTPKSAESASSCNCALIYYLCSDMMLCVKYLSELPDLITGNTQKIPKNCQESEL